MNKQTKALTMAIEALEEAEILIELPNFDGYKKAIQACKEALEQPSIAELNDEYLRDTHVEGLQPAQEPVAKGFIRSLVSIDENGIETWKEEPFYTSAPSWQGLSNDEKEAIIYDKMGVLPTPFEMKLAEAIEQALKEKNNV